MRIPELNEVQSFLLERFANAADVTMLKRGGWSSAFGFRVHDRPLVIRFGQHREDYEKDRIAADWATTNLPIPAMIEMGSAFDGAYAISVRHYGDPLDAIPTERMPAVIEALFKLLERVRDIELKGTGYGIWLAPSCDAPYSSWREYLLSTIDRDEQRLTNWRQRLSDHRQARAVFDRGCAILERLVDACPNDRKLVHNDVLNNVLIDERNNICALFDWGNSLAGDPLYDIAWLCLGAPWYPSIDTARVLAVARERFPSEPDLAARMHCYELHLRLGSLQYFAYAGLDNELNDSVYWTAALMARLG